MLRVVAGVFFDFTNKKLLFFERGLENPSQRCWEFPGGKVELGESDEQALVRELREELDLQVEVGDFLGRHQGETPSGKWIDLVLYQVSGKLEKIVLKEHFSMRWAAEDELSTDSISVIERPLIKALYQKFL